MQEKYAPYDGYVTELILCSHIPYVGRIFVFYYVTHYHHSIDERRTKRCHSALSASWGKRLAGCTAEHRCRSAFATSERPLKVSV